MTFIVILSNCKLFQILCEITNNEKNRDELTKESKLLKKNFLQEIKFHSSKSENRPKSLGM